MNQRTAKEATLLALIVLGVVFAVRHSILQALLVAALTWAVVYAVNRRRDA